MRMEFGCRKRVLMGWRQGLPTPNHPAQPHRVPKQQSPVTLNWLLWSCEPGEIVSSLKLLSSSILLQQHIVTLFVIHDKMHSRCSWCCISKNASWHLLIRERAGELSWHLGDGIGGTQYTFPPRTPHNVDTPGSGQCDPANSCMEVGVGSSVLSF